MFCRRGPAAIGVAAARLGLSDALARAGSSWPPQPADPALQRRCKSDLRFSNGFVRSAAPGILNADAFHIGTGAADAEDRIVYNSTNGGLYYDVDGTGSQSKVLIASLRANLAMTNLDFEIV